MHAEKIIYQIDHNIAENYISVQINLFSIVN